MPGESVLDPRVSRLVTANQFDEAETIGTCCQPEVAPLVPTLDKGSLRS